MMSIFNASLVYKTKKTEQKTQRLRLLFISKNYSVISTLFHYWLMSHDNLNMHSLSCLHGRQKSKISIFRIESPDELTAQHVLTNGFYISKGNQLN